MFAIVCDKCGKTAVLDDGKSRTKASEDVGFCKVFGLSKGELDLCTECYEALLGTVRGEEDGNA